MVNKWRSFSRTFARDRPTGWSRKWRTSGLPFSRTQSVGKQTAFSTDVHVPLIVAGPGVRRGATVDDLAENVDLRPTFEELAGIASSDAVDGTSLVPLLRTGEPKGDWRQFSLIENHGPKTARSDAAAGASTG